MNNTFQDYQEELREFSERHNASKLKVYTSPLENDSYHKEYYYSDGATFYEINTMVTEYYEVEAHNIKVRFPLTF